MTSPTPNTPGTQAATTASSKSSTSQYNVPGGITYNADSPVDFIIASSQDPQA